MIDDGESEARLALEIQANPSENPDRLFERRWALMLPDRVLDQLAAEFGRRGKADEFEALSPYLAKDTTNAGYAGLAEQLVLSEGAIRVAVHRMRKRYREILQREILVTVASEDEVDSEIEHLFSVLC